jgi:hypothetical protein
VPYCLTVDIVDHRDGEIYVTYTFWGHTAVEARDHMRRHEQDCSCFAAAVREGRTVDELEEIDEDEMPEAEADEEET